MTAVAPPTNVHARSWSGGQSGLDSMPTEIFMPRSKASQRYSLPSSLESGSMANGGWVSSLGGKKKPQPRAGSVAVSPAAAGWPKSDAGHVVRTNNGPSSQPPSPVNASIHQPGPILPSQHLMSGPPAQNAQPQQCYLMLLPLNGTFERKQIPLPYYSDTLRIGRQTNAKTIPTQTNGFFDSKVLSRQHAEVWADRNTGKVWIRDIKSSNGTWVNGQRLSQENQESEPHELRTEDVLELGIDIVGEDGNTIVHHKVAARVEHAGVHIGGFDMNFGDMEPLVNGSLMGPQSAQNNMRGRNGSQSRGQINTGAIPLHRPQQMILSPSMEMVVKRLNSELFAARQQSEVLQRTSEVFDVLLKADIHTNGGDIQHVNIHTNGEIRTNGVPPRPEPQAPQPDPSQMLSLVGELARARKEVDFTSARIQDLEVALKKEKHAREAAEDRAAQLEIATQRIPEEDHTVTIDAAAHAATALHARMEEILVELKTVKSEMRAYKLRAEAAELRAENVEKERDSNQKTLAETIQSIRKEEDDRQRRRTEQATQTETVDTTDTATQAASDGGRRASAPAASQIKRADSGFKVAALSKEHSLLLRKQASVPYASMLGVVLIGVGLMAVINNWQRGER